MPILKNSAGETIPSIGVIHTDYSAPFPLEVDDDGF
jgi:hypothetical protein